MALARGDQAVSCGMVGYKIQPRVLCHGGNIALWYNVLRGVFYTLSWDYLKRHKEESRTGHTAGICASSLPSCGPYVSSHSSTFTQNALARVTVRLRIQ